MSVISIVSESSVVATAHASLGLVADNQLSDIYIAASLRRAAGVLCPCSPKTLIRTIVESHHGIAPDDEEFAYQVERVLDSLVAGGDLLELSQVTTLDETVKATWLFAAPPSFVTHPSGRSYIIGVSTDEATPIPVNLQQRIRYQDVSRILEPLPSEELSKTLLELGLRQLSLDGWLRHPRMESPGAVIGALDTKLSLQGSSGELPDLRILDHTRDARHYRDRWYKPGSQSGRFIIRRPQAYGADLWGYAELQAGKAMKLVDFPTPGYRWRGCDMAWRAQMAIDALKGQPQTYASEAVTGGARLDFFSPIPDWARRRLATVGQQVVTKKSLLSFALSEAELNNEIKFLFDHLFLNRTAA